MDNFHELRDDMSDYFTDYREIKFPLTDDVKAIEQFLWRETDQAYRDAVQRYEKVKANVAVKVESEDKPRIFRISNLKAITNLFWQLMILIRKSGYLNYRDIRVCLVIIKILFPEVLI
jgi:hypothetical protein